MVIETDRVILLRNKRTIMFCCAVACVSALITSVMGTPVGAYIALGLGAVVSVGNCLLYTAEIRAQSLVDSEDLHRRRNL